MAGDLIGAGIVGVGTWAILIAGVTGLIPATPRNDVWVVTASEKGANRPDLVRAAPPRVVNPALPVGGGKGLLSEG